MNCHKILIIEQDHAMRASIVEGLKLDKKYRIYEANNANRVDVLLKSEPISIAILGMIDGNVDLSSVPLLINLSIDREIISSAINQIKEKVNAFPVPEIHQATDLENPVNTDEQGILLWVGKNERILDDLSKIAGSNGLTLIHASSAYKTLRELRSKKIEYIFIDQHLDDMSALSLVRSIRKEKSFHIPIALLTAPLEIHERIDAVHAGVSLFLAEECGLETLSQGLRQLQVLGKTGRQRILVIDDDQGDITHFINESLANTGFQVSSLNSHLRLLELMSEIQTDLLLINCEMEESGAFEVCRTLRTIPDWQSLPIILIGKTQNKENRMATFKSGADDYISMDLDRDELILRISSRLERTRMAQERADRDGLTGLLIRRAFNEALLQRINIAKRKASVVSICLIDLDHFKSVNDTYGHLAGDRVLATMGRLLTSSFRAEDLRGRWGGEEFIVAFSGEDLDSAKSILERARQEFIKLEFEGEKGEVFKCTFSSGIACYPDHGEHIEQILKVADERLYVVKQNGRNQILAKDHF